jgi:hypothetical protein
MFKNKLLQLFREEKGKETKQEIKENVLEQSLIKPITHMTRAEGSTAIQIRLNLNQIRFSIHLYNKERCPNIEFEILGEAI